ncbi:MAG TPA: hypothetical protein VFS77_06700 [Pyrinomonadaceae bacterium]|nr:hypothetical protein [Pyrinomonadaceae bacterium]
MVQSRMAQPVLQRKTFPNRPRPPVFSSNTIQGYYGDAWEPAGWAPAFRAEAQAAIAAEWARAVGYQKGPASARVDVSHANTFAAYAALVYRSDNGANTVVRFGARLSGNPSNAGGRLYADHSVRLTNYNVDCAEYYLIKQARRAIPAVRYRQGYVPRPTLYVYSDHSPCPKCQEDFDKLQEQFGDLEVVVMWEQRYHAHQADDRWVIPNQNRVVGIVAPENPAHISGVQRPTAAEEEDGWEVVVRK